MKPATVWFTGLPCSGKTTLALALAQALRSRGEAAVVLDGDDVRLSLSSDLSTYAANGSTVVRLPKVIITCPLTRSATAGPPPL